MFKEEGQLDFGLDSDPYQKRKEELNDFIDGDGDRSLGRGTKDDPHPMPPHGSVPLSEFRCRKGLDVAAFPTLFPFGCGGFADDLPIKRISWSVWSQHLTHYFDGRFARHPRFRYFMLNVQQRHLANEQASLFVRTEKPHLTVGDVRRLSDEDKSEIRRQCDKYCASLRNSPAFFKERKEELKSLC